MSESASFDFSKFVPGFDFLQKLVSGNHPGASTASSWIAPTLDPQELERRIKDLRAVQFWLEQNTQAVAATIQALEVQRMTLATLQGMNVSMGELAEALKVKPTETPDPVKPTPQRAKSSHKTASKPKAAAGQGGASAGGVDPMAWWGSLTQQFQQIAGDAMKDMQRKAETMAPSATPPGPSATAKAPAGAKPPRPTRQSPRSSKAKK